MRKRTKWLCSVLLVATIGLTGCGQKQKTESRAEKSDENHFVGEWIVEPEYAISKVGDENTLFVDGRGEKKAILGTVKGAIATVWQDWSITEGKQGDEKWGCIQEPEQLEETLGNLGITKDKEIILIGETLDGWGDDARLLWELRAAGYELLPEDVLPLLHHTELLLHILHQYAHPQFCTRHNSSVILRLSSHGNNQFHRFLLLPVPVWMRGTVS